VGVSTLSPSGGFNPGTISINGQREFSNAFTVNGSDAEEDVNSGTAIIPDLDSVAEFRILTNNFDSEYADTGEARSTSLQNPARMRFTATRLNFVQHKSRRPQLLFSDTRRF